MQLTELTKRCSTCRKVKGADAFAKHARGEDGLQWCCRECTNQSRRRHRALATVERIRARMAQVAERQHAGKACCACSRVLPLQAFGKDERKPDGRRGRCIECSRAQARASDAKYRKQNREKVRAASARLKAQRRELYAGSRRTRRKRDCIDLSERYVRRLLTDRCQALTPSELPSDLIEAKRLALAIDRTLNGEH